MAYGFTNAGFDRKPLALILREIEDYAITEFGADLIQTPQSPMGQLNGIAAEMANDVWAIAEGAYQQLDVEQATADALRFWASLRGVVVGDTTEDELREALVANGSQDDELKPLMAALSAVDGVTWRHATINDSPTSNLANLAPATIAIAVEGGADADIAAAIRGQIYAGMSTFGNTFHSFIEDGFERRVSWIRPVSVPTVMQITARIAYGAAWPEDVAIIATILDAWSEQRRNGRAPDWLFVRRAVEAVHSDVEITGVSLTYSLPVLDTAFGHFHMAALSSGNIEITHEN